MKLHKIKSISLIMYRALVAIKTSHKTQDEESSLDRFPGEQVTLYIKLHIRKKTTPSGLSHKIPGPDPWKETFL